MKKVIVRLGNGLGNQLFTYAAAYSFSKKNNAKLYVDDTSGFYKRYKYELHNFNITAPIIETKYKFIGAFGKIKRKILIKFSNFNHQTKFLIEKRDQNKLSIYDIEQFNIHFNNKVYIEGYFQSEKYYKEYINNLLKEFSFKDEIIKQENNFINDIKKNNSVSIHLRQDKFMALDNHNERDKLNSEYLYNNIQIINKGIKYLDKFLDNPKYFIFSNDFRGLREMFPTNKFIFVDANLKKDPAYDLYLMSLCKHFILSPSTLHYWAAQLSCYPSKICLSPSNIKNKSGYYGFSNNKDIKADWWKDI